jgi:hypothetical protein
MQLKEDRAFLSSKYIRYGQKTQPGRKFKKIKDMDRDGDALFRI